MFKNLRGLKIPENENKINKEMILQEMKELRTLSLQSGYYLGGIYNNLRQTNTFEMDAYNPLLD